MRFNELSFLSETFSMSAYIRRVILNSDSCLAFLPNFYLRTVLAWIHLQIDPFVRISCFYAKMLDGFKTWNQIPVLLLHSRFLCHLSNVTIHRQFLLLSDIWCNFDHRFQLHSVTASLVIEICFKQNLF